MATTVEPVNTKKVEGRRKVRYRSHEEVLADAERLADMDAPTIGNWSKGQIYKHLAGTLDLSIDGGGGMLPAPARFLLKFVFKKKFLHDAVPSGFKAPANFVPDETSTDEGLELLRKATGRMGEVSVRALHPGFGKLSREEWDLFHFRHAEMHM
ncbi:MAG: DUF1569 domain-containing protein, partial [Lacipirellulaceae bacterium]